MKAGKLVELFAKLPAEFTAARNALAKELREGGDEERAKRVLELRRPTAAQWAANQLARRNEDDVAALVETTDRMRKMQARGTGAGDELRAAMGEQRGALARLETAAEGALREAGLSVSPAVLRSVQRTLQAAAAGDKDLRQALQEGRLESEQEPSGFEALLGASPRGAAPSPRTRAKEPAAPSKAQERKEAAEAKRRAKEAAQEAAQKAREIKAAETLVRKLEEKAAAADRAANEARDRAREARAKLHELRARS
ncbi:MAG: hypothetical protein E6J62_10695 [Deltaproteobacteria bacterium]|nr:MAG: hypothetical protein E6J85_14765 [Deltaproteobacteria bacterium]TMB31352.1 MAG: hypothetical protein E6J61_10405 [Deltaproteobacteria bacterium]TMB33925.1 MAG: hypothetical protein E6J62_10695 [Deltaproteobacteria bacterium]